MTSEELTKQDIIDGLSNQISIRLVVLEGEQVMPSMDADSSDQKTKDLKDQIIQLRAIRQSLEHVFFGGRL